MPLSKRAAHLIAVGAVALTAGLFPPGALAQTPAQTLTSSGTASAVPDPQNRRSDASIRQGRRRRRSGDFIFTTLETRRRSIASRPMATTGRRHQGGRQLRQPSIATASGISWSASCQFGTCLAFNGTSSFVDTPDDDVLSPGINATFEAWVS